MRVKVCNVAPWGVNHIDENIIRPRMSATAKECMTNMSDDKNKDNESKVMNEDKWIKP